MAEIAKNGGKSRLSAHERRVFPLSSRRTPKPSPL